MAARPGVVYIVGAGPGAPGLLTVRGRDLLASVDAIVYERRAQRKLFSEPGPAVGGRKAYYVGRARARPRRTPGEVQRLIIRLARKGDRVVYLTHGDPFALGRGSELAQALHDGGIEFEIVPGVPADNSAATYAGIPLVSQTLSAATIFASGEPAANGEVAPDWSAIARVGGTVVVRDARRALPAIVAGYALADIPGEIPAAVIHRGGTPAQRILVSTLGNVTRDLDEAAMTDPITLVIGWTVLLRDELAWFDNRPLFGSRILFAQARHGSDVVADRLRELGATVINTPEPRIARLDVDQLRGVIDRIGEFNWIVFSSADAVEMVWDQLLGSGRDSRALAGAVIACVGPSTAAALLDRGITVNVVQERFEPTPLLDVMADRPDVPGAVLLYIAGDATAESFGRDLEQTGADVTALAVYREVPGAKSAELLRRKLEGKHTDLAVVMSPAGAEDYLRIAGETFLSGVPAAAYDATTAEILRHAGVEVVMESGKGGPDAFVDAVRQRLAPATEDGLPE